MAIILSLTEIIIQNLSRQIRTYPLTFCKRDEMLAIVAWNIRMLMDFASKIHAFSKYLVDMASLLEIRLPHLGFRDITKFFAEILALSLS